MATLSTLKKRIDQAELRANPLPDAPFHIISKQSQAEIAAIRAEVAEYERLRPYGPEPLIIELVSYLDE